MSDLVRLSMSIEKELYEKMASLVKRSAYTNRSEFIRDLVRKELVEKEWLEGKDALAAVTIVYDHHTHGLTEKLIELQHHHMGQVLVNMHVHLGEHRCAEVIVLRGRSSEVRRITDSIRSLKGVLHTAVAASSTGEGLT